MSLSNSRIIVEGHAIVSEDGMIADAQGEMPPGLRNETDWRLFQAALDRTALVVLGRLGHERHPNPGRRRLVMTRQATRLAPDPSDPRATFWNPASMPVETALQLLGVTGGILAVTGGTETFDFFLPHYDRFVLSEVPGLLIPGGAPCFTGGAPPLALANAGLAARETLVLDPEAGVTQTQWRRTPLQAEDVGGR
jgi:hypothetical protein